MKRYVVRVVPEAGASLWAPEATLVVWADTWTDAKRDAEHRYRHLYAVGTDTPLVLAPSFAVAG